MESKKEGGREGVPGSVTQGKEGLAEGRCHNTTSLRSLVFLQRGGMEG